MLAVPFFILAAANVIQSSTMTVWALILQTMLLVRFCLKEFHKKIALAFFYVCVFTFLTGKIMIDYFRHNQEWLVTFSSQEYICACNALYLAYLCLWAGYQWKKNRQLFFGESSLTKRVKNLFDDKNFHMGWVQDISFYILMASSLCMVFFNLKKLEYAMQYGYMSLYTTYAGSAWASRMEFACQVSFFTGLAAKPSRKRLFWYGVFGLINPVIEFAQGSRGAVVTQSLFFILYLYSYSDIKKGSLTKAEYRKKFRRLFIAGMAVCAAALPVLAVYGVTRSGGVYAGPSGIFGKIIDFFDQQGFSFSLIGYAVKYKGQMPNCFYSFGALIDQFFAGAGFQGKEDFALHAHSFGDSITYIVAKTAYLNGYGMGSSYIAELYYDFGYLGIAAVNIGLGAFMKDMTDWKNRSVSGQAVCFFLYRYFLGIPRGAFAHPFQKLTASSVMLTFFFIFGLAAWKKYMDGKQTGDKAG